MYVYNEKYMKERFKRLQVADANVVALVFTYRGPYSNSPIDGTCRETAILLRSRKCSGAVTISDSL